MGVIYKSCTPEAMAHVCDPCMTTEGARVRGVLLFDTDSGLDETSTLNEFESGIESGKVHVIPETSGSYDGGTDKTGDGYGDETERKLGEDHVVTFNDPSFAGNRDFWQKAEKKKWHIAFRSETKLHVVADAKVRISAHAPVAESIDDAVVWNVTASWFSKDKPAVVDLEAFEDLFSGCPEVTE